MTMSNAIRGQLIGTTIDPSGLVLELCCKMSLLACSEQVHLDGILDVALEVRVGVHDLHGAPAQHVRRPHHARIAQPARTACRSACAFLLPTWLCRQVEGGMLISQLYTNLTLPASRLQDHPSVCHSLSIDPSSEHINHS